MNLLSELKGLKIVKILALEFKKLESDNKTKYYIFKLKSRNSY